MKKSILHLAIVASIAILTLVITPKTTEANWPPDNANRTYPRTLLKANEIDLVRKNLSRPANKEIYKGVYTDANRSINLDDRTGASRIAKNAAFVYLMGVDNNLQVLSKNKSDALRNKVINVLENFDTEVDGRLKYTNWQYRTKELIDLTIAYDLLRGAKVSENRLSKARSRILSMTHDLNGKFTKWAWGFKIMTLHANNITFMTAAALGTVGIVIDDDKGSEDFVNNAMVELNSDLFTVSDRLSSDNGGYSEGPYYLKYGFEKVLPFFETMKNYLPDGTYTWEHASNKHTVRHPAYDTRYQKIYEWLNAILLPDGRMPALEDGYTYIMFPEISLADGLAHKRPITYQPLQNALTEGGGRDQRSNYLASLNYINSEPITGLYINEDAGSIVYRSKGDETALYYHQNIKKENMVKSAKGHNQADEGSYILYYDGEIMALDPGYIRWERRKEVSLGIFHNLVTVNGNGPQDGSSSVPTSVFLKENWTLNNNHYTRTETGYNGAKIERETLIYDDKFIIVSDTGSANTSKTYDHYFHGAGSNKKINDFMLYSKNGRHLGVLTNANNDSGSYDYFQGAHETTYDQTSRHITYRTRKKDRTANFTTVLYPYRSGLRDIMPVKATSSYDLQINKVVTDDSVYLVADNNEPGNRYAIKKTDSGLKRNLEANANLLIFKESGNNIDLLADKFKVIVADDLRVETNKEVNIDLSYNAASKTYTITTDRPNTLKFKKYNKLYQVTGNKINKIIDESSSDEISITTNAPTTFTLTQVSSPAPPKINVDDDEKTPTPEETQPEEATPVPTPRDDPRIPIEDDTPPTIDPTSVIDVIESSDAGSGSGGGASSNIGNIR